MDTIENVIDSIGKAGKFCFDKAVDAKEYVTLEYKLSKVNGDINRCFKELGKAVYEVRGTNGTTAEIINKIDALKIKKAELTKEIESFKKTR